jgi:histone H3/H4
MNTIENFRAELHANGLDYAGPILADGKPHAPVCAPILPDAGSRRFHIPDLIEEALTSVESERLAALERDIEAGQRTFIKMGTALAEIRDNRLYKSQFKTFEEYCREKWNFSRAHAYRLIDAAEIAKKLSPVSDILSERVARELAKVPKDQRKEIFNSALAKAESEARTLTTKDISDAFRPMGEESAISSNAPDVSDGANEPAAEVDDHRKVPVSRIPASAIATRPDLMQFKRMDDSVTGVNDADKLTGQWDDYKAGNLLLWEPLNPAEHQLAPGKKYVVANGHHRFAFGQSQDVKSYNAQIVREADGFSPKDAARLAAEINIDDGKGTIYDQVKFIRKLMEKHGEKVELEVAQRIGSRGRAAQDIGFKASAALFDSFNNEQITPEATRAIANAAPDNEAAQRIGIKAAVTGKSPEFAKNLIKAVINRTKGGSPKQIDLFGKDDTAMKEMDAEAQSAEDLILDIRQRVQALRSAGRRPEIAASEGIDVRNPASVEKRLKELMAELAQWEDWPLHPGLVAKVRAKIPASLKP